MGQIEDLQKQVKELSERLAKVEGPTGTTYVAVVQDKSSSMAGREAATISGFNEYIADLQSSSPDGFKVTLTQFDTTAKTVFSNLDLAKVEPLTTQTYKVGGATALFDAIGQSVSAIRESMGPRDKALVLVMTDGEENSSKQFNRMQIVGLIDELEATDNWTFVYLGADQDAWAAGTSIGIKGGNTFSYAKTDAAIGSTFSSLATATTSHRRAGGQSTSTFTKDYMEPTASTSPTIDTDKIWVPGEDEEDDA